MSEHKLTIREMTRKFECGFGVQDAEANPGYFLFGTGSKPLGFPTHDAALKYARDHFPHVGVRVLDKNGKPIEELD